MVLGFTKLFHAALTDSVPTAKKHMLKPYVTAKAKPKKSAEIILLKCDEEIM